MKKIIAAILFMAPSLCFSQHTVIMKSGERMNGEVQSMKEGMISFLFKGNAMNLKVADVQSIQFSDAAASRPSEPPAVSGTKGVSYVMNGRKLIKQPVINNLTTEKGIVVVEITINKYGNVIKAEPGAEGTTTTSQYLLTKAKQAAESVAFDYLPTSPIEQKGTISITF
jgi:hypothetical protein